MKYFQNVQTVEELKRQYKKLAFEHHPDRGGRVEDIQAINAEYDILFATVKNVHETADGKTYTKEQAADVPDNFRAIIDAIISFDCTIELCGSWLWVFNAYAYRQELKALGFFWCSSKKAWAWTDKPTENKYRLTLEEIRRLHGSEIIKEEEKKRLQAAV
ncbi:MAG: molecular chaperone DnaJ [Clostridia bacterium]|jgi:curved DNA-binding protein CbpA|nr:molecular chaperone DnaJ [Clostridia bacterium]